MNLLTEIVKKNKLFTCFCFLILSFFLFTTIFFNLYSFYNINESVGLFALCWISLSIIFFNILSLILVIQKARDLYQGNTNNKYLTLSMLIVSIVLLSLSIVWTYFSINNVILNNKINLLQYTTWLNRIFVFSKCWFGYEKKSIQLILWIENNLAHFFWIYFSIIFISLTLMIESILEKCFNSVKETQKPSMSF